jgi:hypothetical protein
MIRSLTIFILLTVLGFMLFAFEIWGTPAPKTTDPDIGAGLLTLLSIGAMVLGIIGVIISSIRIIKRS